jgi:hypothetical protein
VAASPFADKPADSYANVADQDGKPRTLLWGAAPITDFGSRSITFDQSGVRQLHQIPAPGMHPRILFTPDDLPDIRRRLRETRCGQEAWKNILSWTTMLKGAYDDHADYAQPDRYAGGFGGLHGRVPLFRFGMERPYNRNPSGIYLKLADGTAKEFPEYAWNVFALEAFRCLIEQDDVGARTLAKAVVTAMHLDQAERQAKASKKNSDAPLSEPVGRFQLAYTYDFIYAWLDQTQRQAIHDELAAGSWSHDNYGTFNEATASRSNWATFSYWLMEVLAIEGEPGFNDLKVRGMYRGWRNLLTYGWFQSGATFEGEAKNQLGLDGIIPFAMRTSTYGFDNLCGHPYLRAYATRFLPHSIIPTRDGFIKYDLLGGSRTASGGFTPCDLLGLKYMLPDDKIIDWVYRQAVGKDYSNVPERPDGYFNGLLFFAIFATDFDPGNDDPAKLGLGNTFSCGERALLMTRSEWASTDALMLTMHTRQANGGHPFPDRNAIMLAGAGRVWSPNGYASFATSENSVVCIDQKSQDEWVAGRMIDIQDQPLATFAVGDSSYAWDWDWKTLNRAHGTYSRDDVQAGRIDIPAGWELEPNAINDFAMLKLPFPYLATPLSQKPHWLLPVGAISPVVRKANFPVRKALRTAGLVRGAHPYAVVIDDICKDDAKHRYDWTLALEDDIQIVSMSSPTSRELDIILTGDDPLQHRPHEGTALPPERSAGSTVPAGQPMLLVRVLNRLTEAVGMDSFARIVEPPNARDPKKYHGVRRLVVPAECVSPDFKVLLVAYRQGAPLPITSWDAGRTQVTVSWPDQQDELAFTLLPSGRTRLEIDRAGQHLITLDKDAGPLH